MKLFARPSPRRAVASAIVGVFVSVLACFAIGVGKVQAQVSLDLRDADLRSFVEIVSENTGRSFVVDPAVRGTVTVLAPNQLTADELYEVFLSVLELNRLTVIEGAGADRIVQMNTARELSSGDTGGISSDALAQQGWQIEVPQDVNGNRLVFVETEYDPDQRRPMVHTSATEWRGAWVAGAPVDVPAGRWIDLRFDQATESSDPDL